MTEIADGSYLEVINPENQKVKVASIKRASRLVNSVHDLLCTQISKGQFRIQEQQQPIDQLIKTIESPELKGKGVNKRSLQVLQSAQTVDLDQHKQLLKRFRRQHKLFQRNLRNRSMEMQKGNLSKIKNLERSREDELNRNLEDRRNQIQKRMSEKQTMIQDMVERKQQSHSLQVRKILYQEKEQQFKKNVLIPRLEEQQRILAKRKQITRPMDINDMKEHSQIYNQSIIQGKLHRKRNSRLISENWNRKAPRFVPKSFQLAEEEEEIKRAERRVIQKEKFYIKLKTKNFLKTLVEIRQKDRSKNKNKQKSNHELRDIEVRNPKMELNREAKKMLGDSYMKQIMQNIDKTKIKPKQSLLTNQEQYKLLKQARKNLLHKDEIELETIRQERASKVLKIRSKKIDQIVNARTMDTHRKYEQLGYQSNRLDEEASQQNFDSKDIKGRNRSAFVMIASIHAKLAMIEITD